MLYYLGMMLRPQFGVFNVLTYHTVRAGGAALTGFLFCLLVGPAIIRRLQAMKVGQYIREEHVGDLHALHKGKAGTPTMGGAMIIVSTVLAILLWGRLSNRLLWVSLGVLVLLGTVGFVDDYLKLRRKRNEGLSARAKLLGQLAAGFLLGWYLINNPITVSASYVYPRDVLGWGQLAKTLTDAGTAKEATAAKQVWEGLERPARTALAKAARYGALSDSDKKGVLQALNVLLGTRTLYDPALWPTEHLTDEAVGLLGQDLDALSELEVLRLDRLLLEAALPKAIAASRPNLHTKVGIPGFKDTFVPLGWAYMAFVVLIIVAMSNAVNLTDGLDGLAAGVSTISILGYTGIAYIVSRADWSQYLFLTYVPEASELFVFGAVLLGTGLGFLWFNSHPAEVFMGDTGSLALGGAIGTMAILTKQELLLPVVGGLFVIEAASVVIQVLAFKLTGKRVFRMAPLHHHFELMGWAETKVTMRFWIIALLFALMSLGTLKLR